MAFSCHHRVLHVCLAPVVVHFSHLRCFCLLCSLFVGLLASSLLCSLFVGLFRLVVMLMASSTSFSHRWFVRAQLWFCRLLFLSKILILNICLVPQSLILFFKLLRRWYLHTQMTIAYADDTCLRRWHLHTRMTLAYGFGKSNATGGWLCDHN